MKLPIGIFAMAVAIAAASCRQSIMPRPNTYGVIIFGESRSSTSDAVQAAQNAINEAGKSNCRPISIGSGAYAGAAEEHLGGQMVNVVVLLECPVGVKILAATGAAVP